MLNEQRCFENGLFKRLPIQIQNNSGNGKPLQNENLKEDTYEIPGFITPVEFSDDVVTKFFLVPTAVACIHTPSPPANQIVFVSYPKGLKLNSLNDPIWVKGDLKIQKTKADVTYSDGAADVETIYQMNNVSVRPYR